MFPKGYMIYTVIVFVLTITNCKCWPWSSRSNSSDHTVVAKGTETVVKLKPIDQKYIVDFLNEFKRLRRKKSDEEIRLIGTVGLVSGALKVEEAMRENLYRLANDLIDTFSGSTPKENMKKLLAIEEAIERDKASIAVLNCILQYSRKAITFEAYKKEMHRILKENEFSTAKFSNKKLTNEESKALLILSIENIAATGKLSYRPDKDLEYEINEKLNDVKRTIDTHLDDIHSSVMENAKQTIEYVQTIQKANPQLFKAQTTTKIKTQPIKLNPSLNGLDRLWNQVTEERLPQAVFSVDGSKSQKQTSITAVEQLNHAVPNNYQNAMIVDPGIDGQNISNSNDINSEAQQQKDDEAENEVDGDTSKREDDFDTSDGDPGGLAGLIANFSGGEGGSDIGGILSVLSQVLTNILGPGGLDIPSVIGTATTLLASLLAGDQNFGYVLGDYTGLAIDGFSGGGGAENNGQFFGQFTGKVIAALSANPEDEDADLQPFTFVRNFVDGIGTGSARPKADKAGDKAEQAAGGSDVGALIMGAIAAAVGGVAGGITKVVVSMITAMLQPVLLFIQGATEGSQAAGR